MRSFSWIFLLLLFLVGSDGKEKGRRGGGFGVVGLAIGWGFGWEVVTAAPFVFSVFRSLS